MPTPTPCERIDLVMTVSAGRRALLRSTPSRPKMELRGPVEALAHSHGLEGEVNTLEHRERVGCEEPWEGAREVPIEYERQYECEEGEWPRAVERARELYECPRLGAARL